MAKATTTTKSLATLLSELRELVVDYAKQETFDPLKRLGRFMQFGVVGSGLLAVGFVLLAMALLRGLQMETFPHWTGSLSWLPYALTLVGSAIVAGLLFFMITLDRRRSGRRDKGEGA